jgi:uncharacterized tellurite resistance protein B-like protein
VSNVDDEQRAKVSQLLQAMIAADGIIKPEEREFMERAIARWKLPVPDAPLSLRSLGSATEVLRSMDPETQAGVLALLVEAAVVDGVLDPREHALLLAAGATMGIDATVLEERILRRLNSVRSV